MKPPLEMNAEALLETGHASAALTQFQLGLTRYHGRTNLLLGAARAAEHLGNEKLALEYYSQLANSWAEAETGHPYAELVTEKTGSR